MLTDWIIPEAVIPNLKGDNKEKIIREMAGRLTMDDVVDDPERLVNDILKREKIESTGIGSGVAIPHAKSPTVKKLGISVGLKRTGVDFGAIDGNAVKLVFMIVSPLTTQRQYLQAIALLAKMVKEPNFKETIIAASTAEDVLQVLNQFDLSLEQASAKPKDGRVLYKEN